MESPRLGDSPDGATNEETAADSDVPEIELIIKVILRTLFFKYSNYFLFHVYNIHKVSK